MTFILNFCCHVLLSILDSMLFLNVVLYNQSINEINMILNLIHASKSLNSCKRILSIFRKQLFAASL